MTTHYHFEAFALFFLLATRSGSYATATDDDIAIDGKSITKYLADGDLDKAHYAFSKKFARSERSTNELERQTKFEGPLAFRGFGLTYTAHYKILADIEQAKYLASEEGGDTRQGTP